MPGIVVFSRGEAERRGTRGFRGDFWKDWGLVFGACWILRLEPVLGKPKSWGICWGVWVGGSVYGDSEGTGGFQEPRVLRFSGEPGGWG